MGGWGGGAERAAQPWHVWGEVRQAVRRAARRPRGVAHRLRYSSATHDMLCARRICFHPFPARCRSLWALRAPSDACFSALPASCSLALAQRCRALPCVSWDLIERGPADLRSALMRVMNFERSNAVRQRRWIFASELWAWRLPYARRRARRCRTAHCTFDAAS